MTLEEIRKFQELVTRLDKICAVANEKNVKLLIDAEQTYYQKAIDYLVLKMIVKYNKKDAVVFNTYQMYLKDSLTRMERHLELSKKDNVHLGVKLVRGVSDLISLINNFIEYYIKNTKKSLMIINNNTVAKNIK